MAQPLLNAASLGRLNAASKAHIPSYPRDGAIGVVHLGLGAFHRAHQALVFDALLRRGDGRWGVLGVAMHNPVLADALDHQDGLYAVQIASSAGTAWQVGGAIWRTCVAAREPITVMQAMAAPATRWVTLTVTEKGYGSALAALLLQGLAARHAAGLGGLTIASCDNLSNNGDRLQALVVDAALTRSAVLAKWVQNSCAFPNSMVDRIVPAAAPAHLVATEAALGVRDQAALATEAFWEWVIERRFVDATDGDALAAVGVTVVDDVSVFEEAKLRLLNGSHSAMAYIGAVAGLPLISDCIGHAALHQFIYGLLTLEVGPRVRRADWQVYRGDLLARFANAALRHRAHQIANDGSQKIPQRWVPSVQDALEHGLPIERLAFAAAAWMRYLRGVDESGQTHAINDPMAEQLQALTLANAASPADSVQALGSLPAIWGERLPQNKHWLARVTHWLGQINQLGMLAAVVQQNVQQSAQHAP